MGDHPEVNSRAAAHSPSVDGNTDTENFAVVNLQPPSYQKVDRPAGSKGDVPLSGGLTEERMCRICLEEDQPESMIAPCKCRGGSKWVHRDCLDEWRTNEKDRAFSKCTECLFEYYMQPVHDDADHAGERHRQQRRKARFCWNVSRDVCLGTLLSQVVIAALGALIYACDANKDLPELLNFQDNAVSLYYLLGWLLLLVLTGLYGSITLCANGCSVEQSLAQMGPLHGSTRSASAVPPPSVGLVGDDMARGIGAETNAEYYRRARHRRQRNFRGRNGGCGNHPEHCCYYGCYDCHPICCVDMCNTCNGCCDCCCEGSGGGHSHHCCSGTGGHSSGDGGNSDCGDGIHILLFILLLAAIVLALIGFFVGIVMTVIAFQRIVQRHIYLLQKRQLVQEFQVMDLQDYDLDIPLATAPPEEEDIEATGPFTSTRIRPSAPVLPEEDAAYLHKLGLMDER